MKNKDDFSDSEGSVDVHHIDGENVPEHIKEFGGWVASGLGILHTLKHRLVDVTEKISKLESTETTEEVKEPKNSEIADDIAAYLRANIPEELKEAILSNDAEQIKAAHDKFFTMPTDGMNEITKLKHERTIIALKALAVTAKIDKALDDLGIDMQIGEAVDDKGNVVGGAIQFQPRNLVVRVPSEFQEHTDPGVVDLSRFRFGDSKPELN